MLVSVHTELLSAQYNSATYFSNLAVSTYQPMRILTPDVIESMRAELAAITCVVIDEFYSIGQAAYMRNFGTFCN